MARVWFRQVSGVEFEASDGIGVLLDLHSGSYFRLNGTGAAIWLALERSGDPERIAEIVVEGHRRLPEQVMGDVLALLDELTGLGLIVRSEE